MSKPTDSRREFVQMAAYVAPAILTLMAAPSFAKFGSEKPDGDPKKPKRPEHPEHPKD